MLTYLERRDPQKKMARFYAISLAPTLFGPCAVIREWGRIGSPGTVREEWFDDVEAAETAAVKLSAMKRRRGYSISPLKKYRLGVKRVRRA
jgi:predicted DNA-binding WGR domain protein